LTAERAKPAVPLGGKYRLVDIPLSNCIHSGLNRIFVMTQFNSTSLNRHVNDCYKFDNVSNGFVEILAATQTSESGDDWYQGTADAVRKHLKHLLNVKADHYLILSGDQLYRMDYRSILATHLRSNADITVSALPVTKEAAKGFGILRVQPNGRIHEFVEKPSTDDELANLVTPPKVFERSGLSAEGGRDYLGSMGVYLIRRDVLEDILTHRQDWVDFGQHVIPRSLRNRRVFAHLYSGFWEDIGTVRSYYEVSMELVAPNPPFEFHDPHQVIYTRARHLPGSRLQGAVVSDSIICEGSRITGATIVNCIVGIRSIIQRGAQLERSIVMGADYYETDNPSDTAPSSAVPIGVGRNSRITGAIIDKNARIGKGVVIRGSRKLKDADGPGYSIREGIVIVLKNAIIPDGTQIG
jgi:glucose-1-phosphate adenylyltransferase